MRGKYEDLTKSLQARLQHGGPRSALGRVLAVVALIAVGAAGAVVVLQYSGRTQPDSTLTLTTPNSDQTAVEASTTTVPDAEVEVLSEAVARAGIKTSTPDAEVEVLLSPEAVARAGIKTSTVTALEARASVQVPGIVMANGYQEVRVTPIVGGIVTKVYAELGAVVKQGAPLATLFSTELAEAQTKYLSGQAMLEAAQKKLQRTRELIAIGAVSRQELEEVTAVHASHHTEVTAARQRLLLLGLTSGHVEALPTPEQVVSEVVVPAPIDGVITGRSANLGQVIGMGQEMFVVTDLAEVWVVGDLYEQDFQTVDVGSEAVLTIPAYPGLMLRGQVTYVDPRVDPTTRTAKVRVEVPNQDRRLRLGMYITMVFTAHSGERRVAIPRAAIQTIGERHVVFVPVGDEAGKFIQHPVRIGQTIGDICTILSGLEPGDVVVTEGSFYLRAESLRNAPPG